MKGQIQGKPKKTYFSVSFPFISFSFIRQFSNHSKLWKEVWPHHSFLLPTQIYLFTASLRQWFSPCTFRAGAMCPMMLKTLPPAHFSGETQGQSILFFWAVMGREPCCSSTSGASAWHGVHRWASFSCLKGAKCNSQHLNFYSTRSEVTSSQNPN